MLTPFQQRARAALESTPFFSGIDAELFELVRRKVLAPGQILFQKGDESAQIYAIVSGRLKVFATSPEGRDVTFAFMGPGELFGELGVADDAPRSASVMAISEAELAVLSQPDLGILLRDHPKVAAELVRASTATVRRLSERAEDAAFLSLEQRLAKIVADLATRLGERDPEGTLLHLRQQDLADLMSVSRESINKILTAWKAEGVLELRRGAICLHRLPEP
ncbi:MAG: Crp/Fnr family transcriptional regulator [Myxococcota bacterium]